MKRIISFVAALAAAVSCTMEIAVTPVPGEVKMVEMEFSSEMTKTSLAEANAVNWEESDQIAIFDDIVGDPCLYTIKTCSGSHATFTGSVPDGSTEFYALYPHQAGSICVDGSFAANLPADQSATAGDVSAALMVAYTTGNSFTFKNAVSLIKFTLAEAGVSMITLTSDGGENIAGDLEFDFDHEARTISLTSATEPSVSIVSNDELAQTTYYLAVAPANLASGFTITMYDDQPNEIGSMVFGPKELVAGKMYNAGTLTTEGAYVDPHKNDTGWYRVMDTKALRAGDELRIGAYVQSSQKSVMAGSFDTDHFSSVDVQYNNDQTALERIDMANQPLTLTLGGGVGAWTLTNGSDNYSQAGQDIKKNAASPKMWTIAIDNDGVAKIMGVGESKWMMYNSSSPRFKMYNNQKDVFIYKKYGSPVDAAIRVACDAEFQISGSKVEDVVVTMGAVDNVFPTVVTTSTGAKTFNSSNTGVATVDSDGVVTLVSDGTTVISVEIAETETMKAGSAQYSLTVNPAPAENVDVLNRAWTGIEDGTSSYSDWSGKIGSISGNTYAGNTAGDHNSIQMRSNNSNSGIVVTASAAAKTVSAVSVVWNSSTTSGRKLDIYGKHTAYESAADLYDNEKCGTKLGSIVNGTSTSIENIEGEYEYIGIRSNSGALYLDNIQVAWENAKPSRNLAFAAATDTKDIKDGTSVHALALTGVTTGGTLTYSSSSTGVATIDNSGAITLVSEGTTVITAVITSSAEYASGTASYTLTVVDTRSACSAPTASVAAGEVAKNTTVTLSCVTPGSTIYYRIGASGSFSVYSSALTIDISKTIYAYAIADGYKQSETVSFAYTVPVVVQHLTLDFENEASTYTGWKFPTTNPLTTGQTVITAHGGSKHGTTDGKASASVETANLITNPRTLTCYISKSTNNTTSSSWKVQYKTATGSWTDFSNNSKSASSVTKGSWTEFKVTFPSNLGDVYVRVYYDGTTAVRCIDDIDLEY